MPDQPDRYSALEDHDKEKKRRTGPQCLNTLQAALKKIKLYKRARFSSQEREKTKSCRHNQVEVSDRFNTPQRRSKLRVRKAV